MMFPHVPHVPAQHGHFMGFLPGWFASSNSCHPCEAIISKLVTSYIMSYHVISVSTHIRKLVVLICLDPIFQVSCPLHLRYLQVNHSKSYSWHSPAWTITRQWAFSSAATEPWVPYWLANPGGSTLLLLCLGRCWPVYAVELCSFSGLIVCGEVTKADIEQHTFGYHRNTPNQEVKTGPK